MIPCLASNSQIALQIMYAIQVLKRKAVKNVLCLMYSCGMYNNSGKFAFQVR